MKLTFNKILIDYLYNCITFKQRLERHLDDPKKLEGCREQNFYNFQNMKDYLGSNEIGFKKRKPTKAEKQNYKIEGDFPLIEVFEYREQIVPVYLDDYGQQVFAIYNNKELAGGTYETAPYYYWCYYIDKDLEKKFFENDEYADKEWNRAYKLYQNENCDN